MKLQIPNGEVNVVADWAELYVLSTSSSLAKLELNNFIKLNLPEITDDTARTALVDSVFNELTHRKNALYGISCHYEVVGNNVNSLIPLKDLPEVGLCLIFSLKGVIVQTGKNNGTKFFEQISNIASKTLIGNSFLVGFPNDTRLNQQIEDACKECLETKGHEDPKKTDKDGGVDIIAWKDFGDKRTNKIVVLIQCGAGKHFDKKKPINLPKWGRWVHWSFEPLTGMTTPKIIRDNHEWQNLSDWYKLILDRPRLTRFIHNSPHADATLKNEIEKWCLSNIK
jgi:hypothetical protein